MEAPKLQSSNASVLAIPVAYHQASCRQHGPPYLFQVNKEADGVAEVAEVVEEVRVAPVAEEAVAVVVAVASAVVVVVAAVVAVVAVAAAASGCQNSLVTRRQCPAKAESVPVHGTRNSGRSAKCGGFLHWLRLCSGLQRHRSNSIRLHKFPKVCSHPTGVRLPLTSARPFSSLCKETKHQNKACNLTCCGYKRLPVCCMRWLYT